MSPDFDTVWMRIIGLEGSPFRQIRGQEFTYRIVSGAVVPSTTNRNLPRSSFEAAYRRRPLKSTAALQDLQGPSYLFAILTDPRVASERLER